MFKFYKKYILDILNWFYFRGVVNKHKNTDAWKALNLRLNRIGEIYTVVRLRDEDLGEPDEVISTRILELCREHNLYIASMDIQFEVGGLVAVDYYYIEQDPNALLVIWQPKLNVITLLNTIKFIILNAAIVAAGLIIWFYYK